MIDWGTLLKNKYPEYDPNHPHYNYGQPVQIDEHGQGIVMENYVVDVKMFITKRTFGLEAGTIVRVPYSRLGSPTPYKVSKSLKWKVGTFVECKEDIYFLTEDAGRGHWMAMLVEHNSECIAYVGSVYSIWNPYREYFEN